MTAVDLIDQLWTLPPQEVSKVREWLNEQEDESPELLAAIDASVRSLEKNGGRVVTREELEQNVRQWAFRSR